MAQLKIMLGLPSSGTRHERNTIHKHLSSKRHLIGLFESWAPGPNFNKCWAAALSAAKDGQCDRAAVMHEDLEIVSGEWDDCKWIDVLEEEREKLNVPFISTAITIKDWRHLLSCGFLDPNDEWDAWRRITGHELKSLPDTFTAEMVGYPDRALQHNFGFALWDMTDPIWQELDENGFYKLNFNYTEVTTPQANGRLKVITRSEDVSFSQKMAKLGIKSAITQKLSVRHWDRGVPYETHGDWGTWKHDEELRYKWEPTDPWAKHNTPLLADSNGSPGQAVEVS